MLQLDRLIDPLTGVWRREFFVADLVSSVQGGRHLGIIGFDCDNFKPINLLGHESAGNAVLSQIGRRLRDFCGQHAGCQAYRVGGDEFAVIASGPQIELDGPTVEALASELHSALTAEPYAIYDVYRQTNRPLKVNVSMAFLWSDDPEPLDDRSQGFQQPEMVLWDRVDAMIPLAKLSDHPTLGKVVAYDPKIYEQVLADRSYLQDLLEAAERGDVCNWIKYQPVVEVRDDGSHSIVGFELLVESADHHPRHSIEQDHRLLENSYIAGLLFARSLENGLRDLAVWNRLVGHHRLFLSINLHVNLITSETLKMIQRITEEQGVSIGQIQLEIVESSVLRSQTATIALMQLFIDAGVTFALDDFPLGNSFGLTLALRGYIQKMKLDRQITEQLREPTDGKYNLECRTASYLGSACKEFGVTAVAEGVELLEQVVLAQRFGFTQFQGNLFGKKIEAYEVEALLEMSG